MVKSLSVHKFPSARPKEKQCLLPDFGSSLFRSVSMRDVQWKTETSRSSTNSAHENSDRLRTFDWQGDWFCSQPSGWHPSWLEKTREINVTTIYNEKQNINLYKRCQLSVRDHIIFRRAKTNIWCVYVVDNNLKVRDPSLERAKNGRFQLQSHSIGLLKKWSEIGVSVVECSNESLSTNTSKCPTKLKYSIFVLRSLRFGTIPFKQVPCK